ncbi:MAG: mannonate dehydratase [Candidatus Enteromonas sp.]|nr:mannonate dehydratase [Candidatus Enteromonas sp.]
MKLTFRWYGPSDSIPLAYLRQIPNLSGVVTACYSVPVGEIWPKEALLSLKKEANSHGLAMEVIESIPVHEDIKLGRPTRDHYIDVYAENLRAVASVGVKVVCYNFMPVFDWLRTEMRHQNPDGSNSLAYSREDFEKIDPKHLHLPGWDESYGEAELQSLLQEYSSVSHEQLFQNLVYFLKRVIPVCEEVGIKMAIHPDDPPWDVFGLPRIVSCEADLDKIFEAVPSLANGLTLCTGSFGAGRGNDIVAMVGKYCAQGRVHFLHLRNILYTDDLDSFCEVGHCSKDGSLDMAAIVLAAVQNGFDGYVRPDHGRNIFGEDGKPGYGLYDRALGCAYINGLFEMAEKCRK